MIDANQIDEAQLAAAIGRPLPKVEDIDDVGYELAYEASESSGLGLANLWEQAKAEFQALICTDDPRYKDIRDQAAALSDKHTATLVAMLSAALGAAIGVGAAVIAPLIALLLLAVAKLGTQAYCNADRAS